MHMQAHTVTRAHKNQKIKSKIPSCSTIDCSHFLKAVLKRLYPKTCLDAISLSSVLHHYYGRQIKTRWTYQLKSIVGQSRLT